MIVRVEHNRDHPYVLIHKDVFQSRADLQPNCGQADGLIAGRRVWHRSTIERWLSEVDP